MTTRNGATTSRSADVKGAIRDSATRLFAEHGFAATGVRDIAAAAGVDPTLVMRHFGSKEGLFLETMNLPDSWLDVMDGSIDEVGPRLVRFLVEARGKVAGHNVYTALIRASDRPDVSALLQRSVHTVFVAPLIDRLTGRNRDLRARMFAAQAQGLMTAMWISEDPVIAHADIDYVTEVYGRALQLTLMGVAPSSRPEVDIHNNDR